MVSKSEKKESLISIIGRPKTEPCQTFSKTMRDRILALRSIHEGWGAQTIYDHLLTEIERPIPSVHSIYRLLKQQEHIRPYQKHRPLDSRQRLNVETAHQCWEMDDKGADDYKGIGYIGIINIKDVLHSVHLTALAFSLEHSRCHLNTNNYRTALRMAFMHYGLPEQIQADHGSLFYENQNASPFPTRLHLWLLGLGITLRWSRQGRPTDQAQVERSHEVLHKQMIQAEDYLNLAHFQDHLNERRAYLNRNKLDLISPRSYNPLCESSCFDAHRILTYLSNREWFRKVSSVKTLSLGGQIYYLKTVRPYSEARITCEGDQLLFHFVKEQIIEGDICVRLPIKGISYAEVEDTDFLTKLAGAQLCLPFELEDIHFNTTL